MKLTLKEKELWNKAIRTAVAEVKKYDGIIIDDGDRNYIAKRIFERLAYKLKKENNEY